MIHKNTNIKVASNIFPNRPKVKHIQMEIPKNPSLFEQDSALNLSPPKEDPAHDVEVHGPVEAVVVDAYTGEQVVEELLDGQDNVEMMEDVDEDDDNEAHTPTLAAVVEDPPIPSLYPFQGFSANRFQLAASGKTQIAQHQHLTDTIVNGSLLKQIAGHCSACCPNCDGFFSFINFGESANLRCHKEECKLEMSITEFIDHYSRFDIMAAIIAMQKSSEFVNSSKFPSPTITTHDVCAEDGEFFNAKSSSTLFNPIDINTQIRTPMSSSFELSLFRLTNTDFVAMNEHLIPQLTSLCYCILSRVPEIKGSSDERFLHLIVMLPTTASAALLPAVIAKITEISSAKVSQFYFQEESLYYSDLDLSANNWGIGLGKIAREMRLEFPDCPGFTRCHLLHLGAQRLIDKAKIRLIDLTHDIWYSKIQAAKIAPDATTLEEQAAADLLSQGIAFKLKLKIKSTIVDFENIVLDRLVENKHQVGTCTLPLDTALSFRNQKEFGKYFGFGIIACFRVRRSSRGVEASYVGEAAAELFPMMKDKIEVDIFPLTELGMLKAGCCVIQVNSALHYVFLFSFPASLPHSSPTVLPATKRRRMDKDGFIPISVENHFRIFLSTMIYESSICFSVTSTTLVSDLYDLVFSRTGIPHKSWFLTFSSIRLDTLRDLNIPSSISDYGIGPDSNVFMSFRSKIGDKIRRQDTLPINSSDSNSTGNYSNPTSTIFNPITMMLFTSLSSDSSILSNPRPSSIPLNIHIIPPDGQSITWLTVQSTTLFNLHQFISSSLEFDLCIFRVFYNFQLLTESSLREAIILHPTGFSVCILPPDDHLHPPAQESSSNSNNSSDSISSYIEETDSDSVVHTVGFVPAFYDQVENEVPEFEIIRTRIKIILPDHSIITMIGLSYPETSIDEIIDFIDTHSTLNTIDFELFHSHQNEIFTASHLHSTLTNHHPATIIRVNPSPTISNPITMMIFTSLSSDPSISSDPRPPSIPLIIHIIPPDGQSITWLTVQSTTLPNLHQFISSSLQFDLRIFRVFYNFQLLTESSLREAIMLHPNGFSVCILPPDDHPLNLSSIPSSTLSIGCPLQITDLPITEERDFELRLPDSITVTNLDSHLPEEVTVRPSAPIWTSGARSEFEKQQALDLRHKQAQKKKRDLKKDKADQLARTNTTKDKKKTNKGAAMEQDLFSTLPSHQISSKLSTLIPALLTSQ